MSVKTAGRNIRAARIECGYKTQKEAAKALGLEQPRLSDLENSRAKSLPETETLMSLAKHFRCSVDRLLRDVDAAYTAVAEPDGIGPHLDRLRRLRPEHRAAIATQVAELPMSDEWTQQLSPPRARRTETQASKTPTQEPDRRRLAGGTRGRGR